MKKEKKRKKLGLKSTTISRINSIDVIGIKAGYATNDTGGITICNCFGNWTICC